MGIDFDAQAVVTPVLDIVIENSPVLIVVEPAQQQRRTPFHHPQGFRGLGRHRGGPERQMHTGIYQVIAGLINLGQAAV